MSEPDDFDLDLDDDEEDEAEGSNENNNDDDDNDNDNENDDENDESFYDSRSAQSASASSQSHAGRSKSEDVDTEDDPVGPMTPGPASRFELVPSAKEVKSKEKEKAADRGFIPIPVRDDDDVELSDEDLEFFEEYGGAASFLNTLDEKGITRCVRSLVVFMYTELIPLQE